MDGRMEEVRVKITGTSGNGERNEPGLNGTEWEQEREKERNNTVLKQSETELEREGSGR